MESWEYEKLINSLDEKELGKTTQVDTIYGIYESQSRENISNVRKNEFIPYETIFPDLVLYRQAKYTDIIHPEMYSGRCFLLSERALNYLQVLNLDAHQIFKCFVHHKQEKRAYFSLYLVNDRTAEIVDWEKCVFTYWKTLGHLELDIVEIKSHQEYIDKKRKLSNLELSGVDKVSIRLKQLSLKRGFTTSFDMVRLSLPVLGRFVSPNFKEIVFKHKLSGFNFEETEDRNRRLGNIEPWPNYFP